MIWNDLSGEEELSGMIYQEKRKKEIQLLLKLKSVKAHGPLCSN